GHVALVERMDRDTGSDQLRRNRGLEVGERENQFGIEREDFRNIGRSEGRDSGLLAPDLRWPDSVAGDADNAMLLAEKIERFHRLFGETNDSRGRKAAHRLIGARSETGTVLVARSRIRKPARRLPCQQPPCQQAEYQADRRPQDQLKT